MSTVKESYRNQKGMKKQSSSINETDLPPKREWEHSHKTKNDVLQGQAELEANGLDSISKAHCFTDRAGAVIGKLFIPPGELDGPTFAQAQRCCGEPSVSHVRIMPDCYRSVHCGCCVGFTGLVGKLKACPGLLGGDIGCGISAYPLPPPVVFSAATKRRGLERVNRTILNCVPMGKELHTKPAVSLLDLEKVMSRASDDWYVFCERYHTLHGIDLRSFVNPSAADLGDPVDQPPGGKVFDVPWLQKRMQECGVNWNKVLLSFGTLGGGNHFVEVGEHVIESSADDTPAEDPEATAQAGGKQPPLFLFVHTGSRVVGNAIYRYWKKRILAALEKRSRCTSVDIVPVVVLPPRPGMYVPPHKRRGEALSSRTCSTPSPNCSLTPPPMLFFPSNNHRPLKESITTLKRMDDEDEGDDDNPPNDKCETDDGSWIGHVLQEDPVDVAHYWMDVVVAQRIAEFNRQVILANVARTVCNSWGQDSFDPLHVVSSPHNFVDPQDLVLRKGAIAARTEQLGLIALNMRDGTLLVLGKGNPEWNCSAAHGCGHEAPSKSEPLRSALMAQFRAEMRQVVSECVHSLTIDERPSAYRDAKRIEQLLTTCEGGTVVICGRYRSLVNATRGAEHCQRKISRSNMRDATGEKSLTEPLFSRRAL